MTPALIPCFPLASVIWTPEHPLMPRPEVPALPDWGHALTQDDDLVAALKILEPALHLLVLAGYELPTLSIRVAPAGGSAPGLAGSIAWDLASMTVARGAPASIGDLASAGFLLRLRPTALALPLAKNGALAKALKTAGFGLTGDHTASGGLSTPPPHPKVKPWARALSTQVNAPAALLRPVVAAADPNVGGPPVDFAGLTPVLRRWMWVTALDDEVGGPWLELDGRIDDAIATAGFPKFLELEVGAARPGAGGGGCLEQARGGRGRGTPGLRPRAPQLRPAVPSDDVTVGLIADLADEARFTLIDIGEEEPLPDAIIAESRMRHMSAVQLLLYLHYVGALDVLGAGRWTLNASDRLTERLALATPAAFRRHARQTIPQILQHCAAVNVTDITHRAYILATALLESRFGFPARDWYLSLTEDHNRFTYRPGSKKWTSTTHRRPTYVTADTAPALELKYWDTCYPEAASAADARDYRGRGFVQLTWRASYQRPSGVLAAEGLTYDLDGRTWGTPADPIDLETHFDHVNRCIPLAARILVTGMKQGSFTEVGLAKHLPPGGPPDYYNARQIVNGHDRAGNFKSAAETYQAVLKRPP